MKKTIYTTAVLLLMTVNQLQAHYLWVETNAKGTPGKAQEIRVYFGEYTNGTIEKPGSEAFSKVKKFTLWVLDPRGGKTQLEVQQKEGYYQAFFTPENEGIHTVVLNNDQIDVMDYSQYDFGIFKTHYHSVAKIQVGQKTGATAIDNKSGITIKNIPAKPGKVKLQLFYKGKPLADSEAKVFISDEWSKTLRSDAEGMIAFNLPWNTQYVVEVTKKEEVPGAYKGVDYEFVWHCATIFLTR